MPIVENGYGQSLGPDPVLGEKYAALVRIGGIEAGGDGIASEQIAKLVAPR